METLFFAEELNELDKKRKSKEIDAITYYKRLAALLRQLEKELDGKELNEEHAKQLIPLVRLLVRDILKHSSEL